jgi:DNA-binding transcriptional ArsR family regulator/rhodanese-related sulfurtransferase
MGDARHAGRRGTADQRARKAVLYEQFARIGKALANPARLELLDLLAQGERSVEDLAAAAGMKLSNTSAQLKALTAAGLVAARRDGTKVFHRLTDDQVAALVEQVKRFAAARLAEAERAARDYLGDVEAFEPLAPEELARRIEAGDVIVIDVRPRIEYDAGHLPGAINLPHDQLDGRLAELTGTVSPGTDIVAYCRGRYCVFAPQAVRLLRENGYPARLLDAGVPEWRLAGLPVTSGSPS